MVPDYTGKICIGDLVQGTRNGEAVEVFVYNVADHIDAFNEVSSQGIAYTAGVPPVVMAMLIFDATYDLGMMNVEDLDPRPLFSLLDKMGLPTCVKDAQGDREWNEH
jgi:saccharopine dehydrogenase-like NADP-dependent oxidoreductase